MNLRVIVESTKKEVEAVIHAELGSTNHLLCVVGVLECRLLLKE